MNFWKTDKIMTRLDEMLEHAIKGEEIESVFDETKMSALETKLAKYLVMTNTGKKKLEEEKMHISELISDISHQTKTPIANLMLYSQLLAESNPTEEQKQCIVALMAQAEKLNFLIFSLMKASRLETGIISVEPKERSIQELLEEVKAQATAKGEQRNITLNFPEVANISAVYDLKWTTEALFNILDNAIKYSKEGGKVEISVMPYQFFCRIDVKDDGIGMEEDETAKVFQRFYRSERVNDREGVGLGLYLAREIISREGGYIKINSELGKGSTFSVFLRLENANLSKV